MVAVALAKITIRNISTYGTSVASYPGNWRVHEVLYRQTVFLGRSLHGTWLGHCYIGLTSVEFNGAFDIASELLWTEHFSLEGLCQLYTLRTVQKPT